MPSSEVTINSLLNSLRTTNTLVHSGVGCYGGMVVCFSLGSGDDSLHEHISNGNPLEQDVAQKEYW